MTERVLERQNPWVLEDLILPHTLGRSYYSYPEIRPKANDKSYFDNSAFWKDVIDESLVTERTVSLQGFNIFEWIPRNPGLYHTDRANWAREEAQHHILQIADEKIDDFVSLDGAPPDHAMVFRSVTSLRASAQGVIYTPQGKMSMLQGGIGCIRLGPVELKNGGEFWFMSATSTNAPDEGIPLLVPDQIYQKLIDDIRTVGSVRANLIGKAKFVSKELSDLYSVTYGIPRVYLEVLEVTTSAIKANPGIVSVAASFLSEYEGRPGIYASYVSFDPALKGARRGATEWLRDEYVRGFYKGSLLTDFDQQAPTIANSLFSLNQVLTSPDLAREIALLRQKYGQFEWTKFEEATVSFHTHQERIMVKSVVTGDNNKVSLATGQRASSTVTSIERSTFGAEIDLKKLAEQLAELRSALNELPDSPERDVIKGAVGKAEMAANQGDERGAVGGLKELNPFASKVLDIAEKIGVGVAVAAIKSAIGV